MKRHKAPTRVTLEIDARTFSEYTKANREIARRTGAAPGVEALLALMLRSKHAAHDVADIYCYRVLRQSSDLIELYRRE